MKLVIAAAAIYRIRRIGFLGLIAIDPRLDRLDQAADIATEAEAAEETAEAEIPEHNYLPYFLLTICAPPVFQTSSGRKSIYLTPQTYVKQIRNTSNKSNKLKLSYLTLFNII